MPYPAVGLVLGSSLTLGFGGAAVQFVRGILHANAERTVVNVFRHRRGIAVEGIHGFKRRNHAQFTDIARHTFLLAENIYRHYARHRSADQSRPVCADVVHILLERIDKAAFVKIVLNALLHPLGAVLGLALDPVLHVVVHVRCDGDYRLLKQLFVFGRKRLACLDGE